MPQRALTVAYATKVKTTDRVDDRAACPRCGVRQKTKGKSARAKDGMRLCIGCRSDRVWVAVATGQMTFEEAVLKYPPKHKDDEEEAS